MTINDHQTAARRCGLPTFLLAAGTMALVALGFAVADAQEPPAKPDAPAAASSSSGPEVPADRKAEIEKVVREYLLANPEILSEVQQAYEAKKEKEQVEHVKTVVKENAGDIFKNPAAAVGGNPKGDVTIVEFFDYNCGVCRRGFGDIAKVMEQDPNVRFVFKELPIVNPESPKVAKVALAARMQGKYMELHRAIMNSEGQATEASALRKAKELGLDMDKLNKDKESPEIKAELDKVMDLATKLNINGTPFFMVGDQVIPGVYDNLSGILAGHVADVRKNGCSYC